MNAPLHGLILAGGQSRRMGRDKGALDYHGMPQTQYLARLMAPLVGKVFVSIRAEQRGEPHLAGLDAVADRYDAASPLNGIVSAMRAVPEAAWLVAAVDMPWIDAEALRLLIAERDATRIATCFESPAKGGPDPLLAIWEPGHADALEAMLLDGAHACPRSALKTLGAAILSHRIPPRMLANINTPEERASWSDTAREGAA